MITHRSVPDSTIKLRNLLLVLLHSVLAKPKSDSTPHATALAKAYAIALAIACGRGKLEGYVLNKMYVLQQGTLSGCVSNLVFINKN